MIYLLLWECHRWGDLGMFHTPIRTGAEGRRDRRRRCSVLIAGRVGEASSMRSVAAGRDWTRLESSHWAMFRSALLQVMFVLNSVSDQNLLQNFILGPCRLDYFVLLLDFDICVGDLVHVGFLQSPNFGLQRPHILFLALAMGSAAVSHCCRLRIHYHPYLCAWRFSSCRRVKAGLLSGLGPRRLGVWPSGDCQRLEITESSRSAHLLWQASSGH